MDEQEAIAKLAAALKEPDAFEELLALGALIPEPWKSWPPQRLFEFLRCLLQVTQDQVALKSGLAQSQVSRVEGGEDARVSTWRKAYHAMGFDLVLLPVARVSRKEMERMAEEGRMTHRWWRQHARPRRRFLRRAAASVDASAAKIQLAAGEEVR
jgi:hypothetical protein